MGTRLLCTAIALTAGLCMTPALAQSGSDASGSATKVLASSGTGFNVSSVEALIQRGDAAVASGNLVQAKKDYDKARTASKQLLAFYRDLSGSFRGLDARIPREMDTKGRAALALLAQSNLRLAALFRRQGGRIKPVLKPNSGQLQILSMRVVLDVGVRRVRIQPVQRRKNRRA